MSDRENDYEVGYGKPPRHTQFKKGQSGNPKGRPKGAHGLKHDLRRVLDEKVTVTENGEQFQLSKQQLVLRQLSNKAIKGDLRAIDHLTRLAISHFDDEPDAIAADASLSSDDEAILRDFIERHANGGRDE